MTGRPWKELEAEGVKRCFIVFDSGKRCRRRAVDGGEGTCEKHVALWARVKAANRAVLDGMKTARRK